LDYSKNTITQSVLPSAKKLNQYPNYENEQYEQKKFRRFWLFLPF
jgi:hypothetical protein